MADTAWSELRRELAGRPAEELVELLRALCERSADDRRFLAARLGLGGAEAPALEEYRARILSEFEETGRAPRLGAARKAIRDYRKAAADIAGTADLMLAFVEAGAQFSREHGDMSENYYGSLGSTLRELADLLRASPELREVLLPRLQALKDTSRRVGWTWGGFVAEIVDGLGD